jgi:hypothetical protein
LRDAIATFEQGEDSSRVTHEEPTL